MQYLMQLTECLLLCRFVGYQSPLLEIPDHYQETMMSEWQSNIDKRAKGPELFMKEAIAESLDTLGVLYDRNVTTDDRQACQALPLTD